jgi:hypothetical protein
MDAQGFYRISTEYPRFLLAQSVTKRRFFLFFKQEASFEHPLSVTQTYLRHIRCNNEIRKKRRKQLVTMLRRFSSSARKQSTDSTNTNLVAAEEKNDESSNSNAVRFNSVEQSMNSNAASVSPEPSIPPPPIKKGMLDKISSGIIKNWRTRYFHLEDGICTYFEPVHWYLKGEYDLFGMEFYEEPSDSQKGPILRLKGSYRMALRCKDEKSKIKWKEALTQHIEYANKKGRSANLGTHFNVVSSDSLFFSQQSQYDQQHRFTSKFPLLFISFFVVICVVTLLI